MKKTTKKSKCFSFFFFYLNFFFFHQSRYLVSRLLHYAVGYANTWKLIISSNIPISSSLQGLLVPFSSHNSTRMVSISQWSNCNFTMKPQEDPLYKSFLSLEVFFYLVIFLQASTAFLIPVDRFSHGFFLVPFTLGIGSRKIIFFSWKVCVFSGRQQPGQHRNKPDLSYELLLPITSQLLLCYYLGSQSL